MPIEISVQCADVANVPADLLLLKHAQGFHGADQMVAALLTGRGICKEVDIAPPNGNHVLLESGGAIAAKRTLFLGTPRLRNVSLSGNGAIRARAIEIIDENRLPVRTLTTTVHGVNYGLDVAESLRALILGFQQGLATSPLPQLEKIIFAERVGRRCELLQTLLQGVEIVSAPHAATPGQPAALPATATLNVGTTPAAESVKKKSVFVAMPFVEEFEDVYQFGIYSTIRRCGYICEKVDRIGIRGQHRGPDHGRHPGRQFRHRGPDARKAQRVSRSGIRLGHEQAGACWWPRRSKAPFRPEPSQMPVLQDRS